MENGIYPMILMQLVCSILKRETGQTIVKDIFRRTQVCYKASLGFCG